MRRKKTTLDIGSVSEGTLRLEDLIPALLDALEPLALSRGERSTVRSVRKSEQKEGYYYSDDAGYDYDDLLDIAQNHSPSYCVFGTHPGDGASIGCWPDWDAIEEAVRDGEIVKGEGVPSARYWRADYFLQVNDHGNATLYRRAGNRVTEEWGVV